MKSVSSSNNIFMRSVSTSNNISMRSVSSSNNIFHGNYDIVANGEKRLFWRRKAETRFIPVN
jgi:hypothetical protein